MQYKLKLSFLSRMAMGLALSFALSHSFLQATAQTVIKMQKEGGVYVIPCKVNDLKLRFIFDTGASKVSISLTEAIFMVKNGYLESTDILERVYSQTATGDIAEGNRVILRKIEFGGLQLTNVEAIIVKEMAAPLLLGQSAISRLGTIQINPKNNELTIINADALPKGAFNDKSQPASGNVSLNGYVNEVTIGNQIWMAENLDVDRFRNGDPIPQVKSNEEWKRAGHNKQPAWCYYENNPANGQKYGKLYNWYAVNDSRGLAPRGWHIPSDAEWTTLTDYLGGATSAGTKMKSKTGWMGLGNGTNESGFSGLLAGFRSDGGTFNNIGNLGYWWSTTDNSTTSAWFFFLYFSIGDVDRNYSNKLNGFSVRCLRD
jgi:clan AA aspartic protease (TIGR02281 family)